MGGFSELIKNFDKTRDYVRDFFIYGCKVRSEFDRKSSRTYDDEKRRVESWLKDYLRSETTSRGKQVSISVDSAKVPENPLFQAFSAKSFTDNDIRLHFLLMDLLADGSAHAASALTQKLLEEYDAVFDEQTVRGKLREYTKEGIFTAEKQGRQLLYRLTPGSPSQLFAAYDGLEEAVQFFSGVPEFGFIGYSLLQAAGKTNTHFLMKHQYIVHILEDDMLLQLLDAIAQKHQLQIAYRGRHGTEREVHCVPMRIHCSVQTGRRYLLHYDHALRCFGALRLDHIRRVRDAGACESYDRLKAAFLRNADKCFGVSFGERKKGMPSVPVRIVLRMDPENEPFILERLQREKRSGSIEQIDREHLALTISVFDPNEMMNWLKTYIGRIVSIEGAPEQLWKFREDAARMQHMYRECEGGEE